MLFICGVFLICYIKYVQISQHHCRVFIFFKTAVNQRVSKRSLRSLDSCVTNYLVTNHVALA